MAEEANVRMEDSLAVWTGDGRRMWCQGLLALNFLACLGCSAAAVVLLASQTLSRRSSECP